MGLNTPLRNGSDNADSGHGSYAQTPPEGQSRMDQDGKSRDGTTGTQSKSGSRRSIFKRIKAEFQFHDKLHRLSFRQSSAHDTAANSEPERSDESQSLQDDNADEVDEHSDEEEEDDESDGSGGEDDEAEPDDSAAEESASGESGDVASDADDTVANSAPIVTSDVGRQNTVAQNHPTQAFLHPDRDPLRAMKVGTAFSSYTAYGGLSQFGVGSATQGIHPQANVSGGQMLYQQPPQRPPQQDQQPQCQPQQYQQQPLQYQYQVTQQQLQHQVAQQQQQQFRHQMVQQQSQLQRLPQSLQQLSQHLSVNLQPLTQQLPQHHSQPRPPPPQQNMSPPTQQLQQHPPPIRQLQELQEQYQRQQQQLQRLEHNLEAAARREAPTKSTKGPNQPQTQGRGSEKPQDQRAVKRSVSQKDVHVRITRTPASGDAKSLAYDLLMEVEKTKQAQCSLRKEELALQREQQQLQLARVELEREQIRERLQKASLCTQTRSKQPVQERGSEGNVVSPWAGYASPTPLLQYTGGDTPTTQHLPAIPLVLSNVQPSPVVTTVPQFFQSVPGSIQSQSTGGSVVRMVPMNQQIPVSGIPQVHPVSPVQVSSPQFRPAGNPS
ncbi:uncharacterized protein FIBRA_05181 [Fibroporia radiculosa]|uniref:Uncharacterized protein n=1 Tax=Fibroporia radiculosa TaxID=599839 RepID=J4IAK3_9APHY|nr:uncharacterized protein FIBRA_05181 [Fibroporia radiculosa]CCM03061.1 predicted protein [Fibroporia radiculosa]